MSPIDPDDAMPDARRIQFVNSGRVPPSKSCARCDGELLRSALDIAMTKTIQITTLLIVFVAACGGSGFSTGVPPNKSLGSVTPAEAQQICSATASFVESKATATGCRVQAVLAGLASGKAQDQARMICAQKESDCLKEAAAAAPNNANNCQPPPASCMATVGEYETCLNDTAANYDKLVATLPTCDKLTVPPMFTPPTSGTIQAPPSCATLQSQCPLLSIGGGAATKN